MNHGTALERADIPILLTTGWNDFGLPYVMEQYRALSDRGVPAFMTIGPWSHLGAQRGTIIAEGFKFIQRYLAHREENFRSAPVCVYFTGAKQWRNLPKWPPTRISIEELYLSPDNSLLRSPPSENVKKSAFNFDPQDPTPNIGLPRPFDDMIPTNYDDTELAKRRDVVVFTSEPLDTDLEICGEPTVDLYHSSDHPNVDLMVRLSEVDGKGKSARISDVYKRLDPARESRLVSLKLSSCAHKFRKRNRIRLIIAGGAHPAYIRNLGTGENPGTGSRMQFVRHTIHHSGDDASKLRLPRTA